MEEIKFPRLFSTSKVSYLICPHCNSGWLEIWEYEPYRYFIQCENCLDKWEIIYGFEADKYFASMLKQPLKKRLAIAWQIIKGE